ncbi:LPS export ABC transporter periplasmic protein LptC [Thioflexithrix psekupsensis]|uniref:LPS export ABC transporter periplasmic protein LptC n=1 Tax=Thioflexithrix psekupsensis TaxID=1570016 RepID=A0A251X4T6_9GAMM|nr:LPS export ABC transporter periplasmic protein LptC [Thioflexithrix psekupsensis]OUD12406.1 LPS export ABC transporter periplasmic protein LptC [Thioflexithrix psekupsensis]
MKNRLIGLLLVILAGGSTWLLRSLDQDSHRTPSVSRYVDYTLHDFEAHRLDHHGQPAQSLKAQQLIHYNSGESELIAPHLTIYQDQTAQWDVRSQRGEVSADGNEIWLLGAVHWRKLPRMETEIFTHDVRVDHAQQLAETQAPSRIIHPNGTTESIGLRVFFATQQVALLSTVRGRYERP